VLWPLMVVSRANHKPKDLSGEVASDETRRDHAQRDQEVKMFRMFVRHPVSDFATWKQAYDDFDGERKGMGVAGQPTIWFTTPV